MSWLIAVIPVLALALAVGALWARRRELAEFQALSAERDTARERGSHRARLQAPDIDLSQCIGCGACVRACPEEGVLGLIYGQAAVIHGARCVGHGRCADACPTGTIALTLADVEERRDLPAIDARLQAVGVPGLFLAGELTGYALVRTAVTHGVAVANEVARTCKTRAPVAAPRRAMAMAGPGPQVLDAPPAVTWDLVIVGAGPGGLACALEAQRLGLRFVVLEQADRIGGSVAAYPRRKLVMTQPMELPLVGRLDALEYTKEELVELWERVAAERSLPIRTGTAVTDLRRGADGMFAITCAEQTLRAAHVCLAVGRRGTPRRLGVPGEQLAKVAYSLLDAQSYTDRHVLVVGGGDSAIEAALGLAEQPGNVVTLSYRKPEFFRLKARNDQRIRAAVREGRVQLELASEVLQITAEHVRLQTVAGTRDLPNGDVFVFAGGEPPFALLEKAGVSFDPADRPAQDVAIDRGGSLLGPLVGALAGAFGLLGWVAWHRGYYNLPAAERSVHVDHELLGPKGALGLFAGVAAGVLFVANLLYLVRRQPQLGRWLPGSLRQWMASHVLTGLLALLAAGLHAGCRPRDSVGGHALLTMAAVVLAGVIGRWFYAFVPRQANGREADLDEVRSQLAALASEWDHGSRGFGQRVREQVDLLVGQARWRSSWLARVSALLVGQFALRRRLRALGAEGRREGIPAHEVRTMLTLAERAHRTALAAVHYDDLRSVLATWRYFHRWMALLLVLLTALHVTTAIRFAEIDWTVLWPWGRA